MPLFAVLVSITVEADTASDAEAFVSDKLDSVRVFEGHTIQEGETDELHPDNPDDVIV